MSLFSLLTIAALLAALAAALLPDAARRRTPGSRAAWPTAAAVVIGTAALANALATGADVAGAALSLLIVALTVVVQAYAGRHLRGDPHARAFFVFSALAAVGATVSIGATDVVLLAGGWSLATMSMIVLIASGGAGPQTRTAVRRSGASLLIGDAALWTAAAVTTATTGSTALGALGGLDAVTAGVVSALVALAAIARAGSFPLHGWLPATAATTTPVSALLHAGFVNAGALLLLRFAAVPSAVGPWLVGLAGAITLLIASLAMLTRPDVKGRLVHSTAAQMGFMLLACALGAFGLALVHAIGHALFKASLFLGAGSALQQAVKRRMTSPPLWSRRSAAIGAATVPVAALVIVATTDTLSHDAAPLLVFALATATIAGARIGALSSTRATRAVALAGLIAAVAAYALVVFPGAEALVPVPAAAPVPPIVAIAVFVAASALTLTSRRPGPVADRLFAFAFAWARPPLPTPAPRTDLLWASASAGVPLEYRRFR